MRSPRPRHTIAVVACAACGIILFYVAAGASSPHVDARDSAAACVMTALLSATQSGEAASALDPDTLSIARSEPDSISPMWPAFEFLLAETYGLRGDHATAYGLYTEVAASGLRPPGSESPPALTLAALSLLRSARLLRTGSEPGAGEVRHLIELSRPMLAEGRIHDMLGLPVLGGLPRLKEALLHELALLAWGAGDQDTASRIFSTYLEVASTAELGPAETELAEYLVSQGIMSEDRLALVRGIRFYGLRKFEDARRFLADASNADSTEIAAEAGYYLARTRSIQGAPRKEILNLLAAALDGTQDPDLIQEILFYRATVFNREGGERDIERFAGDLDQLIERFPAGTMADDALYELARHHEMEGNTDEALRQLARLRDHPGPNDWHDSSYFRAALILFSRAGAGDLVEAMDLLEHLVSMNPGGGLTLAARFWLGRMATELGDTTSARRHFTSVIAACPYDYYAIRSRMHLNAGPRAAGDIWADPATRAELPDAYLAGRTEVSPPALSYQYDRVPWALATGLYAAAISADERLREKMPSKSPSDLTMEDLDRAGAFASVSLLLALRQDALAAAGSDMNNRLAIASSVGGSAGDWPLAMLLVFGLDRSLKTQSVMQHDPHYTTAAYPPVYARLIASAADAHNVPPELLYAVIRRESLFYPVAVSKRGAVGLFQFIPSTFETLDSRWSVLGPSGMASMAVFLRHPALTIELGARWFEEELLERNQGNILLAVMEHNAGYPAVKAWSRVWEDAGRSGDAEYMIETARFAETRIFARSVLADMVIAEAVGLFRTARATPAE